LLPPQALFDKAGGHRDLAGPLRVDLLLPPGDPLP